MFFKVQIMIFEAMIRRQSTATQWSFSGKTIQVFKKETIIQNEDAILGKRKVIGRWKVFRIWIALLNWNSNGGARSARVFFFGFIKRP